MKLALVFLLASACSIPSQSLRTITIPPSGEKVQASDKSFLIYPFEDERGVEAGLFPFIDFVPGVDMIYSHVYSRYPETSGLLRGNVDGRSVVTTGELPHALPYMLGNLLRQMGFATTWAPVDSVDPQRDLKSFDYVIRGRLKSTRLHLAGNFIPLALLSVVGVPCVFADYRIEYEIILFKNQPEGGELMRKSYVWTGKQAIGLFYHWTAAYDLFVEGLAKTLPKVVSDLRLLCLVSALAIACAPSLPKRPTTPARVDLGWKTMRAQHQVSLDVTRADGTHDQRRMRGVLAAERPGKFRLRALGPAGITLFDLLVVDGRVKVMEAIKDPRASALGAVIASLAGDLSAALLLEPAAPGRAISTENDRVIVKEPGRTVTLSRFVLLSGHAVPTRIEVDNPALRYRVAVDVGELELDVALDPALFAE